MNDTIISIGPLVIKWYSLLILTAFLLGIFLIEKEAKKQKIDSKFISNLCFYLIIVSIIGARLYYVIFNLDYYLYNLGDIFKIWEGGLAIHGGIIASLIFIIYYCKKNKVSILNILDLIVPSLIIGQAIGRWGNFFNQEAFGSMTTYTTLKHLHIPNFIIDGMYINHHYWHPTFFYESIGCLIGFVIIMLIRKFTKTKKGMLTSIYLIMYGIIRFGIETMRQDSLMLFNLKMAQIVSIIMIIAGIIILIYIKKKEVKHDK